jgi:hypothetical protein
MSILELLGNINVTDLMGARFISAWDGSTRIAEALNKSRTLSKLLESHPLFIVFHVNDYAVIGWEHSS